MKFYVSAFSDQGKGLAEKIKTLDLQITYGPRLFVGCFAGPKLSVCVRKNENLREWAGQAFSEHAPLLFIGAAGIAVRAIAEYVKDKQKDSPVLVMDDAGTYVIPILSGHMGGANELAGQIAEGLGAKAVITTATDVHNVWAADVFARRNGLQIRNRPGIAKVSAKLLSGTATLMMEHVKEKKTLPQRLILLPYEENSTREADIVISLDEKVQYALLGMKPKQYVLGIGCRHGKTYEEIQNFVEKKLEEIRICPGDIAYAASIDLKKEEPGLLEFSARNRIPFYVFSKEELGKVQGDFSASVFVESVTGVDNVCERAAVLAADGPLVLVKQAENGLTLALAKIPAEKLYGRILTELLRDSTGNAEGENRNE